MKPHTTFQQMYFFIGQFGMLLCDHSATIETIDGRDGTEKNWERGWNLKRIFTGDTVLTSHFGDE